MPAELGALTAIGSARVTPQWRAGCYARRTLPTRIHKRHRLIRRNGGRAVMPAERPNAKTSPWPPPGRNGGRAVMPAEPSERVDTYPTTACRNGGRAVMPAELSTPILDLNPIRRAAMEGGLLCPPNLDTWALRMSRSMPPQWRAGCYARRTSSELAIGVPCAGPQWRAGCYARRTPTPPTTD